MNNQDKTDESFFWCVFCECVSHTGKHLVTVLLIGGCKEGEEGCILSDLAR